MKMVSPRDFRNAFDEVMRAEYHAFRTAVGFESKSYAYFMRSNIFPKIAKHLGLSFWRKEYHSLDGMFYEERGLDNRGNYSAYAKWISIALEHVTQTSRTHEEMNKLQALNVPLKVLITYAAEGLEIDLLLRRCEEIISDADVFNDISTLRRQLMIVGTPKTMHQWRFYVYEQGGFVHMLPG